MGEDVLSKKKHHGTKKKTPFQLQSLEKYYSEEKYPKHKDMEDYAASLNLTYKQIRIWFVERRRKEKRENDVHGCCKSLQGGRSVQKPEKSTINVGKQKPDKSPINVGKQANYSLGQSGSQSQAKSKNNIAVNPKSYQLKDSMLLACNGRTRHKEKLTPPPESYNRSSSSQERMGLHMSLKYDRATKSKRKYYSLSNNQHVNQTTNRVLLQDLFSKDYILKRLFRKDGPPLGAEFDSLPTNASGSSGSSADSAVVQDCRDSQRISKRRKVLDSAIMESGILPTRDSPTPKYGIGKGLMTMLRAVNFDNLKRSSALNFVDGSADLLRTKSSLKDTLFGASKAIKQPTLVSKRSTWRKKSPEKRKPPLKRKKVQCKKDTNQNKPHRTTCKLSTEENSLKQPHAFIQLVDDEELELRELQAGPNPLRCSAHLTSNGHNCPLCKDLLARFPPTTIIMKQPLCTRPWASSLELVKKLFKVLRFLYNIATTVEICPFTINELAEAFTDKDSMLLGKIHVTLLNYLLFDVQRELSSGMTPRASKDGRFLGFLQFIREQEFDVNIWSQSLNPLTWTEILRQVLVAAGFGSKPNISKRDSSNKDKNLMTKYGLRPRTLKGEIFGILYEQGYGGLKVAEIAKASQIVALDLQHTKEELEQLICSTLSSDITLFEKIAPFAYRLRSSPHIKGEEDYQSDSEDSGSVDDDSGDCSTSSSDDDTMGVCKQKIVKYKSRRKRTAQKLTKYTEIDESFSGEAWALGLMEGEYSNLSVDEKLDALIALVDLAGAGPSLRMEEPIRATSAVIPNIQYHGSGAKIKKSSVNHQLMTQSSAIFSEASEKEHSFQNFSTAAKDKSRLDAHPLQSIHLGYDRRYNSYWLFLGPCNANDPGHRRVYFESSEDGHWDVIDTTEGLEALLSALDCRGTREARLVASLDKREEFLCQAMDDHMTSEGRQTRGCDPSEVETSSGSGSSPISDVDNILGPVESMNTISSGSGDINFELGGSEEKKHKWDRLQSFDKWIWNAFYCNLNAVKKTKRSYMESLARCESCHDLYWRDEKHCRICHTTFELDFDLEERYAIHVATCRLPEDSSDFPQYKVLPSQLQALKAAIHAIEASMPEVALSGSWMRSGHKLWAKRLRRTSSLPELLQVLSDFVGAINEEWLYESNPSLGSNTTLDDIVVYFQTMPQTTSAVALWMVKLDFLIAPHLEKARSNQVPDSRPQSKRRHGCTK